MPWVFCAGAAVWLLALTASPASVALAQSSTGTLNVTALVQTDCEVTGGAIDFGTYSAGQPSPLDATGEISFVNCAGTLRFDLDGGNSGSINNREMANGSSRLDYQLYLTSARNSVWGTGAQAQTFVLLVPGDGSLSVYGRIPGNQEVEAGAYADTVNITLTF